MKKICVISDKKLPKFILKKLVKSLKNYEVKIFTPAELKVSISTSVPDKMKNDIKTEDMVINIQKKRLKTYYKCKE